MNNIGNNIGISPKNSYQSIAAVTARRSDSALDSTAKTRNELPCSAGKLATLSNARQTVQALYFWESLRDDL